MLQNIATADLDIVSQSEGPVFRNVDRQGIVLNDLRSMRPHDDRAAGSQATIYDFERAATKSVHPGAGAFGNQHSDTPRRDDLAATRSEHHE